MNGLRVGFFKLAAGLFIFSHPPAYAQVYDEPRINAAAQAFMERANAPGLAIGVVTPAGRQLLFYGVASRETGTKVNDRTIFEIGSVSKTFTAILAAYAAETGALRWEDAASRHVPEISGTHLDHVSLLDLATHTTGGFPQTLPRDVRTNDDMVAYFRNWVPASPTGTTRSYANPSIGLLGLATARALKGRFSRLVRDKISSPLGLTHTFHDVPQEEVQNYAQGYSRDGQPVPRMPALEDFPLAAEAFGVRSTAGDLLRFVEANLGLVNTDPTLRRALATATTGRFQAGPMKQALIWEWYPLPVSSQAFRTGNGTVMIREATPVTRLDPPQPAPDAALVTKQGATPGFGAYIAFIPGRQVGLALLTNRGDPHIDLLILAEQVFAILGAPGVADQP
ncbi:MAG: serine hydrolase [Rhodospirillaceae bacterium]